MLRGNKKYTLEYPDQEPFRVELGGPELVKIGRLPNYDPGQRAINLLALKLVAFDIETGEIHSPQQTSFTWSSDIERSCCIYGCKDFKPNCACGLYTSTHIEALEYYDTHEVTAVALVSLFGKVHVYDGPASQPWTRILRSEGARLIGVVGEHHLSVTLNEMDTMYAVGEAIKNGRGGGFPVQVITWRIAKEMIRATFRRQALEDPFTEFDEMVENKDERLQKWYWDR